MTKLEYIKRLNDKAGVDRESTGTLTTPELIALLARIPALLAVVAAAKAVSESNASNASHKNCYCNDCELDRALLAIEQPEAT